MLKIGVNCSCRGLDRRGILRFVGVSSAQIRLSLDLLQDNHLLRGHIACCLQRIEVGTAGHLLSGLRPPIPVDGNTSTNLLKLIEAVDHPNFNLNWDPANLCLGGEESVFPNGYNMLKPYIRHIHLKNWRPEENWTTMDDGVLNWVEIITALKRDGYDQYLSIETHHGPLVEKSKHNAVKLGKN